MAMNKTVEATAIVDALATLNGEIQGDARAQLITYWEKICGENIDHFKAGAIITINAFAANAPGVQAGAGVSGNIAGTATGGITA